MAATGASLGYDYTGIPVLIWPVALANSQYSSSSSTPQAALRERRRRLCVSQVSPGNCTGRDETAWERPSGQEPMYSFLSALFCPREVPTRSPPAVT